LKGFFLCQKAVLILAAIAAIMIIWKNIRGFIKELRGQVWYANIAALNLRTMLPNALFAIAKIPSLQKGSIKSRLGKFSERSEMSKRKRKKRKEEFPGRL
ncbi:MAG TPA: hypothetical protein PK369_05385, partial [Thermoclostridium sp.]|nr:hypothetical protein [Thermoclostridium sp.]